MRRAAQLMLVAAAALSSAVVLAFTAGFPSETSAVTTTILAGYCKLTGGADCALTGQLSVSVDPSSTATSASAILVNLPAGADATDKALGAQYNGTDLLSVDRSGLLTLTGAATISSTLGVTGATTLQADVFGKRVAPANLSGDVNDYAGCANATLCAVNSGGSARNITGIAAPSPAAVRFFFLCAINGAGALTLKYESASSAAANRIYPPSFVDATVGTGTCRWLVYDTGAARWRVSQ